MAVRERVNTPVTLTETAARRTPQHARYDLVIIGGGSAGLSAASTAALLGVKVALIDRARLGGECLYTGCVPSKALLHVARVAQDVRTAQRIGLGAHLDPVDLGAVADQVQRVIDRVYVRDAPEAYEQLGVEVLFGEAHFISPRALSLNGHTIRSRAYLIATGSHAAIPSLPGLAEAGYLTNDSVFDLRTLPAKLAVIGGGPVGVELGQAFARLGSQVTILQRPDRLLPREEPDASAVLQRALEAEGITIQTRTTAQSVSLRDGLKVVSVRTADDAIEEVGADAILVAVGRSPTVEGLGLEAAGVMYDRSSGIATDDSLRSSNARILVAGDARGAPHFTHAAALQARTAVRNALTPFRVRLDTRTLPWATFTTPEVAHVGLTESEARTRHGDDVCVYTQPLSEVDRADTEEATEGFVKLVATRNGDLLGAHLVGLNAGEYINELTLAMYTHLRLGQIAATTHVYPTLALAIQQAAGQFTAARTRSGALPGFIRAYLRLFR